MSKNRQRVTRARRVDPQRQISGGWLFRLGGAVVIACAAVGGLFAAQAIRAHDGTSPYGRGEGTGDLVRDADLRTFIDGLNRRQRWALSDELAAYNETPAQPVHHEALAEGIEAAPVRISLWLDPTGSSSAELLDRVQTLVVSWPGSLSVALHSFPRDGTCNIHVERRQDPSIACLAAEAQLCVNEFRPTLEFLDALLAVRTPDTDRVVGVDMVSDLSPARILDIGAKYVDEATLRHCMSSAATSSSLDRDIEEAWVRGAKSSPFILVNGHRASLDLLEVLVLTAGRGSHPAFAALPAPSAP